MTEASVDSIVVSRQHFDSLLRSHDIRDSVYIRDSVFVSTKGDTVYKYVERTKYKHILQLDTVKTYVQRCDTLYIERADSVATVKPVEVVKPMKWYDTAAMLVGRLCIISLIAWAVWAYIRRKKG